MKTLLALAAVLPVTISASAAQAGGASYNGHWPVTITGSQQFNGPHCIVMQNGSALMDSAYYGAFQIINGTILVFFDITGSGEEPASLVFSSPARNGKIGKGIFDFIQGGTSYDSGKETFGTKGGC